ncbi:hypothetical protein G8O29_12255 [Rhodobacter sp. M37P]|uniref:Uncharacterized protein n=2 Tax=Rhodobacter calidifons TaxID=2715277 RepID=A0ABX0G8K8_9RHOB|nr:hypothetical protein [Rhodobacter calidifons]
MPNGTPLSDFAPTPDETAFLTIARHYFAQFAAPASQCWIAALSESLRVAGDAHGPGLAFDILSVVQALRATRQSCFAFNAAGCPTCSVFVTPVERLLLSVHRMTARGRQDDAQAMASILCEGNDPRALLAAIRLLVGTQREVASGGAEPASCTSPPVPR